MYFNFTLYGSNENDLATTKTYKMFSKGKCLTCLAPHPKAGRCYH